jgi:transposase
MSLHPQVAYIIPEETARVARAAFPKGNLYMQMHDQLGMLYTDRMFADLFPTCGQPAESPARLALVLVMQFAENLADRQAADAVRGRIDWKYALGLELTDPGFDFSVLSEFRDRLIAGHGEQVLLDALLTHFQACGLIKARGRQRTDSTHILAAIRSLNRLELVGRTLQHALNTLAQLEPAWLLTQITPDWFDRYSRQIDDYRLPKEAADRQALAETIGNDGLQLLGRLEGEGAPKGLRDLPTIETLRQVWTQQYDLVAGRVQWRKQEDLPPSAERLASPHDPEARYSTKRSVTWVGYKVHLTETCDEGWPSLITHVETTPATDDDSTALPTIQRDLATADRLPCEQFVDTAYTSGALLVTSRRDYGIDLVGPVPSDNSWQAQDEKAFDLTHFTIDWEAQQAICPQGKISQYWTAEIGPRGKPTIQVQFRRADCRACPVRARCTRSKAGARELTLHPQAEQEALQAARQRQQTAEFQQAYHVRAGVEGSMSQTADAHEMRQSRYIGQAKTHLQHVLTAAAINLKRVVAWWDEIPRAKTRISPFAALAPT